MWGQGKSERKCCQDLALIFGAFLRRKAGHFKKFSGGRRNLAPNRNQAFLPRHNSLRAGYSWSISTQDLAQRIVLGICDWVNNLELAEEDLSRKKQQPQSINPEREREEFDKEGIGLSSLSPLPQLPVRMRMLSPRRSFMASFHWALSASVAQPSANARMKPTAHRRFMTVPIENNWRIWRWAYSQDGLGKQQRF